MPMLRILLQPTEKDALYMLADHELRDPRQQAALIIRRELERRGLLPGDNRPAEVSHATN